MEEDAPPAVGSLVLEEPMPMTPEQKALLEKEDKYREEYAKHRFLFVGEIHENPFVASEDVFEQAHLYTYQKEDPAEAAIPKIFTRDRDISRTGPCIVPSYDVFRERWHAFTGGMFEGMDWSNVVAAGGAVLASLSDVPMDDQFAGSDVDLFIHGLYTDEEANAKLRHIHKVVMQNCKSRGDIIRTKRACTILNRYPYRHVQVILRLYKNPGEVLLGFDIDCCAVGFTGTKVYAEERFRRALTKRYNLVNDSRRSTTYELRLFKYSKRGFCTAVPNLDKKRVDPRIFERHISETSGLCKLLLFEHSMLHPKSPFVASRFKSNSLTVQAQNKQTKKQNAMSLQRGQMAEIELLNAEHPSDYSDIHVPWGPQWYTNQILRMLRQQEREHLKQYRSKKRAEWRKEGGKRRPKWNHRHRFVYGIDGVIDGTSAWCIICKKGQNVTNAPAEAETVGPKWKQVTAAEDTGEVSKEEGAVEEKKLEEDEAEGEKKEATGVPKVVGADAVVVEGPKSILVRDSKTLEAHKVQFEFEDTSISGKLIWLKNVPAYQDLDNGFQRHLLTGSFEPVNECFIEGAYLTDDEGEALTQGHNSLIKYLLGKPKDDSSGEPTPQAPLAGLLEAEFSCEVCDGEFLSLNQLRKHKRRGCKGKAGRKAGRAAAGKATLTSRVASASSAAPPTPLGFLTLATPPPIAIEEKAVVAPVASAVPPMHAVVDVILVPTWARPLAPPTALNPFSLPRGAPGSAPWADEEEGEESEEEESEEEGEVVERTKGEGAGVADRQEMQVAGVGEECSEPELQEELVPSPRTVARKQMGAMLMLVARLWKAGRVTDSERAVLKDCALQRDEVFLGVLMCYEMDGDEDDLVDTLHHLVALRQAEAGGKEATEVVQDGDEAKEEGQEEEEEEEEVDSDEELGYASDGRVAEVGEDVNGGNEDGGAAEGQETIGAADAGDDGYESEDSLVEAEMLLLAGVPTGDMESDGEDPFDFVVCE